MTDADDPGDLSARARSAYERTIADPPARPPTTLDPAHLAKLEQAVTSLRRVDREIFLAVRRDAMSYAEIAERTGMTVEQVRRCMARSLHEIGAFRPTSTLATRRITRLLRKSLPGSVSMLRCCRTLFVRLASGGWRYPDAPSLAPVARAGKHTPPVAMDRSAGRNACDLWPAGSPETIAGALFSPGLTAIPREAKQHASPVLR